jgi:hypothetical protein
MTTARSQPQSFQDKPMSYEVREKLIPYLGKRVKVRGVLGKWGDWRRNFRDVGRVCIQSPEISDQIVADYVWVTDVPHWKHLKGNEGFQVEFEAVVRKYAHRTGSTNYCLTNASAPTLLHQPPALTIPDYPGQDDEMRPEEPEMDESVEQPVSEPVEMQLPAPRDAILDWRGVKALARVCGSPAKALEMLDKLPNMPLPLLKEYLMVLSEE